MDILEQIRAVEDQLMNAQQTSDVDTLDWLLADELIGAGPDGKLLGKTDDLAAHRTGIFRIEAINRLDLTMKLIQPDVVVTFVLMDIRGYVQQQPVSGRYRYIRVWTKQNGHWQVTAAHFSGVAE